MKRFLLMVGVVALLPLHAHAELRELKQTIFGMD